MTFLMLFSGCGRKSAVKGEEVFSCNPDNMLGLESVYINEGMTYMQFDEEYVYTDEYPYGVQYFFTKGKLLQNDCVIVWLTDDESVVFKPDDVMVDADAMTLSLSSEGLDPEKITAVTFAKGDSYKVDFEAGVINAQCHGGDCTEFFEQTYNFSFDSWGAAKQETSVDPETSGP